MKQIILLAVFVFGFKAAARANPDAFSRALRAAETEANRTAEANRAAFATLADAGDRFGSALTAETEARRTTETKLKRARRVQARRGYNAASHYYNAAIAAAAHADKATEARRAAASSLRRALAAAEATLERASRARDRERALIRELARQ